MSGTGIPPPGDAQRPQPPDWAELFQRHYAAMQVAVTRILQPVGRTDLAEDAVMQAIVSLMANPPPCIRNPEALLVATAKRKAIDITRSHDITHRVGRDLRDADIQSSDVESTVIEQLDRQRAVRKVRDEVGRLSYLQRRIIRRVVLGDHLATQVAAELGLSPARISQLRTAALATLKDRLAEPDE